MKTKSKPKYNVLQNIGYTAGLIWNTDRSLLLFILAGILAGIAYPLLQMLIAPAILGTVERGESVQTVLLTVVCFSAALMGVSALTSWMERAKVPPSSRIFMEIFIRIGEKACTTSYPNTLSPPAKMLISRQCRPGAAAPALTS